MQEIQLVEIEKRYEIKDFKTTKEDFEKAVEKYKKWEIQDSEINDAKKARATLNNAGKAIAAERIANTKRILGTYTEQCKVIEGLIDEASKALDKQIKVFESKEDEIKTQKIDEIISTLSENKSYVELKAITYLRSQRLSKWLNKSFKLEEIEFEVNQTIEKTDTEIQTLEAVCTEQEKNMVVTYYIESNFSVTGAIKLLQEYRKRNDTKDLVGDTPTTPTNNSELKEDENGVVEEVEYTISFKVRGTKEKILLLEQFLNNNGMFFEQIK